MLRNSKGLIKFHAFIELCRYAFGRYVYTCMLNKPWAGAHVYVHARMCCTGVYTCLADSLSRVVTPRTLRHCDSVDANL